ncbi:MAG: hypothetical protein AAF560_22150 [Acidobacteriota bacterium]
MNQLQLNSAPKPRLAGIIAAVVLILVVGVFVPLGSEALEGGPTPIGNEGPWLNAVPDYNCGDGAVCAEWPNYDTNTSTVCCVDPSLIGSYQGIGNNCYVNFGERVL